MNFFLELNDKVVENGRNYAILLTIHCGIFPDLHIDLHIDKRIHGYILIVRIYMMHLLTKCGILFTDWLIFMGRPGREVA
jgi:hypothetical protein